MNKIQFTTTSPKAYVLEANVTGMNTAKNQQNYRPDTNFKMHRGILRNSFLKKRKQIITAEI